MNRAIFNQKRRRLRIRRIIIVCVTVLLVLGILFSVFLWVNRPKKTTYQLEVKPGNLQQTTPSTNDNLLHDEPPTMDPVRELPIEFIDRHTQAPHIALYDVSAQTLLYSKDGDTPCAPASLTKLMTTIVALEYASLDEIITAGNELYLLDPESSRAGIYIGYRMTLEQALQGLLLKSGNDAAYVIAAQIGHKIDENLTGQAAIDLFCQKMTEKATALGCTNTTFLNPDGIDKAGHETTANDLLKIALYALKNPFVEKTVSTAQLTVTLVSGQTLTWKNSNKLLEGGAYAYTGACGMKTGTTDGAGNCLISCATRDGRKVLCILLGAETDSIRYNETIELLNLGFF